MLSTIVLGSLATVVPTFVEATDEQVGKIEMTEKSTQESEPSEKVGESLPEESEVNNEMDIKAADEGLEEGNTHEDAEEEDEFYYPSNRSDLTSSFRSYAAPRAKNDTISITDVNKPRADFIDVSSHNGYISVEEYKVIRSYGIKGVAVKLTEGTGYRNPEAKNQVANAKAAGLVVSAYHYSWFENEARARKEAQYFSQMANELGLPKSTLMINDLEDGKIKYKDNHTKNAKAFENELNRLGYSRVNHYLGLHWINEKRIDPNQLGREKVWVAAYPFTPTLTQYHTQYGAWQWSSKMTFPGVHGVFDISSDYQGSYLSEEQNEPLPPQGSYISDGRYIEITKKGYSTWSNFDWKYRNKTDNLYKKKFQAKGRYQHQNGATYFSLYDADGKWYGYLNAEATSDLKGPEGNYLSDGRYVSISKDNYTVWNNLNFSKVKAQTKDLYQKTYQAKCRYEHFNGDTYYSLYDNKGTWLGYLNVRAAKTIDSKNGVYISDGRYVTVSKKGYDSWRNFSWVKKESTENIYDKTFLAKGRYENFNGATYLSLYDEKDTWYGYINENGVKVGDGAQGAYISDGRYATVIADKDDLYNDFDWKVRKSTNDVFEKTFQARGRYQHMNGKTYYSLYDNQNKWQGYAESDSVKFGGGKQGAYLSDGRTVSIVKKNYSLWGNFGFNKVKGNTTKLMNEQYIARGRYEHGNGNTYFSLFDKDDNWLGYLNADATEILK